VSAAEGVDAWGMLLRVLRIVVIVYVLFAAYAWLFADRMLFLPQPSSYRDSPDVRKVRTADAETLAARWLPNPRAAYTLLVSHGNAEDVGDLAPLLEDLHAAGFSVLAWDYRGYGLSTGKPRERTTYRDAEAVFAHLTGELGVPAERVIVLGRSLGGGPAAHLASRHRVAGLVLESTFTSVFAVFPGVPLLPFDKFRTESRLARVTSPVLVIHGRRDDVVPFAHGERLYARAPEPKRHLWIDETGHNDLQLVAGKQYLDALRSFAAEIASGDVKRLAD
jgi:abhydrolase domain-containing protein 17